jgi:hypothetical protein
MKNIPFLLLMIFVSCASDKKQESEQASKDATVIEREITNYYQALLQAYRGVPMNTDSLVDNYFDENVYYVTYWGITEPIDSTKLRLRRALPGIKDYENRIENLQVKVYGDGAYAFFVLRQTYTINGIMMDEYLPTTFVLERRNARWLVVHSQRSADFQTIQHQMNITRLREK